MILKKIIYITLIKIKGSLIPKYLTTKSKVIVSFKREKK